MLKSGMLVIDGVARSVTWRKAAASASGNCIAAARSGSSVYLRDSKRSDGGVIALSPAAWVRVLREIGEG